MGLFRPGLVAGRNSPGGLAEQTAAADDVCRVV